MKIENTNEHYHTKCCVRFISDYISNEGGKIVGLNADKRLSFLTLEKCTTKTRDLRINNSKKKFLCDIKAYYNDIPVYIEVVNTNRDILRIQQPTEKFFEYMKFGCIVVLIDVLEWIKNTNGDEEALEKALIEGISVLDRESKVLIFDFRYNIPSFSFGDKTFEIKSYSDEPNYIRVETCDGQVIAITKTRNGFVYDSLVKKYGENVFMAKHYDDDISFYENILENKL